MSDLSKSNVAQTKITEYICKVVDQNDEAKFSTVVFKTQTSKDILKPYIKFLPILWFELHISYIICLLYVQIMKKNKVLAHIMYKL